MNESLTLKRFWKIADDSDIIFQDCANEEIDQFLFERYNKRRKTRLLNTYYTLKPLFPRKLLIFLRRIRARATRISFPNWPIEEKLEVLKCEKLKKAIKNQPEVPFIWFWPEGKNFTFVITHDVETEDGMRNIPRLLELEKQYGFNSSWNFVAEKYFIDRKFHASLSRDGFEIGVHGLKHDGKLFSSRKIFNERMTKIRSYTAEWGASGFRSPATHRNVDWMLGMPFEYDSSFPDTDPYEPQPGGCLSIFPFFIGNLVELPITLAQDHTIFEILGHKDISVWRQKLDWIEKMKGMALVVIHPDYMVSARQLKLFGALLQYILQKKNVWHTCAKDVAKWWRARDISEIKFDKTGMPYIAGPAQEAGVIAFVKLIGDNLVFEVKNKR